MSSQRAAVYTLALGRRFYFDLAVNLARSFLRFHETDDIRFCIATDRDDPFPRDLGSCTRIPVAPGEFGAGFSPKLHLDQLSTEATTLFLDSDILIYEPLDRLLAALAGRDVATVGREVSTGEWFGDVAGYCSRLGVPAIPKFNGGLYYFEAGATASAVYKSARELAGRYDEMGLVRLRGQPNDELVMSGAMALHGVRSLLDDGTYMGDPLACQGPMKLNVLRGLRMLENPPSPSPLHQEWNPFSRQSPALVHFLGDHALRPPYHAEAARLRLAVKGWPEAAAGLAANLCVLWPGEVKLAGKAALRPLVHALVGTRRIQPTPRD